MPYELFLSYSRKDNILRQPGDTRGWVTALHDEILADHRRFSTEQLRIFFDTSEIADMDDWRHRILTGLRESKILLVCLSPDYFKSPPCLWEWEEYLKRQVHALMGHESVAPVYFVEAPDSDEQLNAAWAEAVTRRAVSPVDRAPWEKRWKDWREATLGRPNWVDLKPWFPHGLKAFREAAVREKLAALGTSLWERIQRARRATGVPGNLRRLNPNFIGRRTELRQLHENLALGAVGVVTAVHGLGGQGKTELATAYAHGWADSYPAGLWVLGAEGKKEILPLLGELCAELKIPLTTGPDEIADARGRRVIAELQRRATDAAPRDPDKVAACLVILDNVSEPALLAEPQLAHIPREDWLRVVVTTREGPEKFPASRQKSLAFIAVDPLTEDDAARLIEDHQIETNGRWPAATAAADAAAAREIARELGGFTLAVESVAIYLGLHPDIRPAAYLARLRAEGLPSVDALPAEADVAAQMQHREKQLRLVLDQTLARLTPAERTALDYAALLPPDSIPWLWLRDLVGNEHPDALAARPGYPDPWPALRRRLEGLRLLTPGDHIEIARLHRLVQSMIKLRLRSEAFVRAKDAVCDFTKSAAESLRYQAAKTDHLWLIPFLHRVAMEFASEAEHGAAEIARCVRVAAPVAMLLNEMGLWNEEGDLLQTYLALVEKYGLAETAFHMVLLNNRARALCQANRLEEAGDCLLLALTIDQKLGHPDSELTVGLLGNLATFFQNTGQLQKGEEVFRQSANLAEKTLGPEHPGLAIRLNDLATFLLDFHQPEEALALCKRALEIDTKAYPPKHPKIAWSLSDLARATHDSGEREAGLQMMKNALAMYQEIYGESHEHVGRVAGNVGVILLNLKRPDEAESFMRLARRIVEKQLGPLHPKVAIALRNLGVALLGRNNGEAESCFRRAISILEAHPGTDVQSLHGLQSDLAILLHERRMLEESERMFRLAIAGFGGIMARIPVTLPGFRIAEANYVVLLMQRGLSLDESQDRVRSALREGGLEVD